MTPEELLHLLAQVPPVRLHLFEVASDLLEPDGLNLERVIPRWPEIESALEEANAYRMQVGELWRYLWQALSLRR